MENIREQCNQSQYGQEDSAVQAAGNNPELWSQAHTAARGVDLLIYG